MREVIIYIIKDKKLVPFDQSPSHIQGGDVEIKIEMFLKERKAEFAVSKYLVFDTIATEEFVKRLIKGILPDLRKNKITSKTIVNELKITIKYKSIIVASLASMMEKFSKMKLDEKK